MSWIVGLLALVLLLALGDVCVARLAARRAARTMSERLRTEADIAVRSCRATPRFLVGGGVSISIGADDVPLPDGAVTLAEVELELRGVRLVRDGGGRIDRLLTDGGSFTARLDAAAVLAATPVPVIRDVEIHPGGLCYHLPGGVSVDGRVEVDDDGDPVFIPAGGPLGDLRIVRIAASVGRLRDGACIEDVRTETGAIVATGRAGTSTMPMG